MTNKPRLPGRIPCCFAGNMHTGMNYLHIHDTIGLLNPILAGAV
jgi:hypothetical protein